MGRTLKNAYKWHVFISHASEDKDAVARPLAKALTEKGLRVWYDEFSLKVGDSLRRKIDEGLKNSRFGVVVLSSHFFAKEWSQKELDGLATREVDGTKVILPVWHGMASTEIRGYSLMLADRSALRMEDGLPHVIDKLLEVIAPEVEISSAAAEYVRDFEAQLALDFDRQQAGRPNVEQSHYYMLKTLIDELDLRHGKRKGRSRRVTAFTIKIARAMGFPPEKIATIAQAALVHDVGKIRVPDAILRKRGKLTRDEIAIVREHADHGYRMLQKIPFLAEAAEVVRSQRERFDGSGYPQGLRGEEIPLGARILSVADAFDAMTSERPYRSARSFQDARTEINEWSGRQFDPDVVKVFESIPQNVWKDMDKELQESSRI